MMNLFNFIHCIYTYSRQYLCIVAKKKAFLLIAEMKILIFCCSLTKNYDYDMIF
jgi:hypothetical protein